MKITIIIGALTLGCVITSLILPSIAIITATIAVVLAFILIMAVVINLGNPKIIDRYVIHKGWHYSIQSVITFLFPFIRSYKGGGITAIINNYSGNKYENTDGSWNKFFGLSYGWNPHNNSMRLAWRHFITDYYECCWYYYVDSRRYESKPFILEYGKDYDVRMQEYDCSIFNSTGILMSSFISDGYYGCIGDNNYILTPYFGGKKRAPKKMIFKVEVK